MEERRKEALKVDRRKLLQELEELLPKYRFWLSEDNYQALTYFFYLSQEYNATAAYVAMLEKKKANGDESSITESEKQIYDMQSRLHIEVAEARQNILAIRDQILRE